MWKTGASLGIARDLRPQAIVDKLTLVHRGILPNRVGTDFHRIISTVNSRCGKYFVCTKRRKGAKKFPFSPFSQEERRTAQSLLLMLAMMSRMVSFRGFLLSDNAFSIFRTECKTVE